MGQMSITNTFAANTLIRSAQVNTNFQTDVRDTYNTHDTATTGIHGVGAGTIVGTTLTQTLTNKTLTSPTVSGGTVNNASIGATTQSTGLFTTIGINPTAAGSKTTTAGTQYTGSIAGNIQTTDATVTTLATMTLDQDQSLTCVAVVSGVLSDGSKGYHAVIAYGARKDGAAAATEVLSNALLAFATSDSAVLADVSFSISGNDILLRVTGAAASTIKWTAAIFYAVSDI